MSNNEKEREEMQKELQWITIRDSYSDEKKFTPLTVYKFIVPMGVLVTAGVLGTGLFYMIRRDSRKQQMLMRYRVLAQGITVGIAVLGIFHVNFSS